MMRDSCGVIAGALCLALLPLSDSLAQVLTRPSAGGTVISFRDPAYDNAWREYWVPASPARVSVASRVQPVADGWRYEIEFFADANLRLGLWRTQLAPKTILAGPQGWTCLHSGPAESIVTCQLDDNETFSESAVLRWTTESPFLPDLRVVHLLGASAIDTAPLDMPDAVKTRIEQVQRAEMAESLVVGPWIATDIDVRGARKQVPLTTILSKVVDSYGSATSERSRELFEVVQALGRIDQALREERHTEAKQLLADLKPKIEAKHESTDLAAIRSALAVIVEFVGRELR